MLSLAHIEETKMNTKKFVVLLGCVIAAIIVVIVILISRDSVKFDDYNNTIPNDIDDSSYNIQDKTVIIDGIEYNIHISE